MSDPVTSVRGNGAAKAGFLAMCFAVVGLVGLFASFAAPLAWQRAVARDATLDEALAAASLPNPGPALEALRDRLDDSAPAILAPGPDLVGRIAAERKAMRERFRLDGEATDGRLRLMICVVTVMGALFAGAMVMGRR